jgi:hypothetical protein
MPSDTPSGGENVNEIIKVHNSSTNGLQGQLKKAVHHTTVTKQLQVTPDGATWVSGRDQ